MRDHTVEERPSSPLELFFDLCFVVAVAFLADELHHGIADGHGLDALASYALLFVPVWWAWMSYTWFATAFSHDDPTTRVLTFAQMAGVLAVAAAVPAAFAGDLLPFAVTYTLMRLPLVAQWLRAAADDPVHRRFALTYAIGSVLAQSLWMTGAATGTRSDWTGWPGWTARAVFVLALAVELGTPVVAVRNSPDRVFHPRHVAERYGLFTIIVLGETVLAVSVGFQKVIGSHVADGRPLLLVSGGLLISFGLWSSYFAALSPEALTRHRAAAFSWGYGHYALFAAIASVGAGLGAQLDLEAGGHRGTAGQTSAFEGPVATTPGPSAVVVAVAVALCLLTLAWLRRAAEPQAPVGTLVVKTLLTLLAGAWGTAGGDAVGVVIGVAVVVCLSEGLVRAPSSRIRRNGSNRRKVDPA